jgi:phosphate starvation-inducible PhoH-like protein
LTELNIELSEISPIDLLGTNNTKLDFIKLQFPNVKIVARGNALKIMGPTVDLEIVGEKMKFMIEHIINTGSISKKEIEMIIQSSENQINETKKVIQSDAIVFGNAGLIVKAKTHNQLKMFASYFENDMTFAIGPAGTGKTYTAVALAVRALKNKEVKRIILTRPAVEAGESLGFLPGNLKDKLDPYLKPLYDALFDMLPADKLTTYLENGVIEIAPLAYMRGRTLDHAFVILDEAQNATSSQLKMFLTRMGKSAKFFITGDITQIDLPKREKSGLKEASTILSNIKGVQFIYLDQSDVVRHQLVAKIIEAYEKKQIL